MTEFDKKWMTDALAEMFLKVAASLRQAADNYERRARAWLDQKS